MAACLIAAGVPLWGQTDAAAQKNAELKAPAYEIVSIKPSESHNNGSSWQSMPDGFRLTGMPLESLVFSAYGIIMESQVSGMPGWMGSDRYDIEAKVDADTAARWEKLSGKERQQQENPMMQSLLVDRCKLKAHQETKELPVYNLVIAKDGLKMKEAPADQGGMGTYTGSEITAKATSIENLALSLSGTVGRIIVDKTGLTARYDFTLKWAPDEAPKIVNGESGVDAGPSIFTALQEQLGLRLVPAKGPVETLVIDHIEKPSAN
jgi:uncharacterized protein (TIGR03435 family)